MPDRSHGLVRAGVASTETFERLVRALIKAGKFDWQAFASPWSNGPGSHVNRSTCHAFMIKHCRPAMQSRPMMMDASGGHKPAASGLQSFRSQRTGDIGDGSDESSRTGPAWSSPPIDINQTIAAFLISRPPIAYLGWGWESGASPQHQNHSSTTYTCVVF